ncbi:MAG: hypothetical protein ABSB39_14660 [Candidatus Sulfotelmatobacter sp.]|jgi:hypothetical protein
MPALDAIFNRSPNTPAQVDMDATLAAISSPESPSLLLATYTEYPSLWINVGTVGTITVNGQTFTDNGWTILAQIYDFPATLSGDPTNNNSIYQTLTELTLSAVIAKLALPAGSGALQKWSQAFYRMLSA